MALAHQHDATLEMGWGGYDATLEMALACQKNDRFAFLHFELAHAVKKYTL